MLRRRRRPPNLRGASAPLPWRQRALRTFLSLPPGLLVKIGGGPQQVDGNRLEPRLEPLCRFVASGPDKPELSPAAARELLDRRAKLLGGPRLLMDRIDEHRIPVADGADEITLRVYSPPTLLPDPPALVYFHGGGWVKGSLDSHDTLCSLIASQTPCRVVSVDYRLAPEHPFPAAVEDAMAAFRWVYEHAESLGVDPRRIAVGGDSAGGNLATVVCLECIREAGTERGTSTDGGGTDLPSPVPAGQFLIYPVTDHARDTESYRLFAKGFGLTRATMDWFFDHYTGKDGDLTSDGAADPRLSPLRAESLAGLPPTILATAGFDVLRDEGDAYGERLAEEGVDIVHRRFDRLIHGFANMCLIEPCRQAVDELINELAFLFHRLESQRG